MANKIYLYGHYKKGTNEVFYIGIGVKFRFRRTSGRSKLWNRYVDKYGLDCRILEYFDTLDAAKKREVELIKQFGRVDKRTGVLVNHTDGGDGALGCITNVGRKHSEESKLKRSLSLKGRKPSPQAIAARKLVGYKSWNKGVPMSDSTKKKLSEGRKGKKASEETKRKLSISLKDRFFSDEHRQKISNSLKGSVKSEEHRRKISEAAKRQWESGNTWYNKKVA